MILAAGGGDASVLIKEYQLDPVTDRLTHCDLIRIDATHEVHVPVHIELQGVAIGVKSDGGLMEFMLRELQVSAQPRADSACSASIASRRRTTSDPATDAAASSVRRTSRTTRTCRCCCVPTSCGGHWSARQTRRS